MMDAQPGALMAAELAEARGVFCATAASKVAGGIVDDLAAARALYTIARGSSDAAANVLSYVMMDLLGIPVTSLPPSVFSLGRGVNMAQSAALVVSQSGASDDLVRAAKGAKAKGAKVLALTNAPGSPVEAAADLTIPINAGPELAVPATKTVIGSIAAGMALLAAVRLDYARTVERDCAAMAALGEAGHPQADAIRASFLRARHVYVIGRDTGFGAAQEAALKIKECCALHAESYSASEVLHGPLQLATNPLMVLILDTGLERTQDSLDQAEARFRGVGCDVHRIRVSDVSERAFSPAGAAALLLSLVYPVILETALALGLNPDAPETLSKVTQTT